MRKKRVLAIVGTLAVASSATVVLAQSSQANTAAACGTWYHTSWADNANQSPILGTTRVTVFRDGTISAQNGASGNVVDNTTWSMAGYTFTMYGPNQYVRGGDWTGGGDSGEWTQSWSGQWGC